MSHPQVLIHERDGRLAALLRPMIAQRKVSLREIRQLKKCLELIARHGPGVIVLKMGRDLEREFTLLERIIWLHPEMAAVVVTEDSPVGLVALAWDLGASYVLSLAEARERLPEIVVALMAQLP